MERMRSKVRSAPPPPPIGRNRSAASGQNVQKASFFVTSEREARSEFLLITSEREARREFLLIYEYTKNLSMSGRPAGRGHAFKRLISLEP